MGLFDRVEGKLERAYNGIFARAFRAEVQPVEIASAIRRAMDDRASHAGRGRAIVPNVFTIELSDTDHDRLTDDPEVAEELVVAAEEHVASQHYTAGGPIRISLTNGGDLETGVFRVRPSTARHPKTESAPSPVHDRYAAAPDDLDEDDDDGLEAPPASVPAARVAAPEHRPAPKPAKVRASDRPCLIVDGHRYLLMGAINVLGRDDDADIILDDPGVSRRHSEIRVSIDGPHFVALIRDLGSTNGTFVNGERVDSEHLRDGDQVTIGRTSMTYRAKRP